jgi:hypothetical protein
MAVGLAIVASGFLLLTTVTTDTPYWIIAAAFAVLGAGMGVTAAPATGEIMSAVPLSKAGVGSAVNDTTRELGGALGIAILGSIANSAYRGGINLAGLGLGAHARAQGEESIGSAAQIATHAARSAVVRDRAASAFADAFHVTSYVSIGIVLVAAAVILLAGRSRPETVDEFVPDDAFDLDFALAGVGAGETAE